MKKKKKNNALEKVENVVEKKKKEKARADRRVELAQIKAAKKEEKQKAKLAKQRDKLRARNARKKIKEEKRIERENARAEKKAEILRLRAAAKEEKQKAKLEKRKEKNRIKYERAKLKEEGKERKASRSHELKKQRRKNGGKAGFVVAIVSLGIVSLVLAGALTFTMLMPSNGENALEAGYSRAFYNTVDYVDNIDLNLSKAFATGDSGAFQEYLIDVAVNSELAENDLQSLPLQDESKFYTTKLVNQIGDYSKYLNKKIIEGKAITEEELGTLYRLYEANKTLKNSLAEMTERIGTDFSFSSIANGGNGNIVVEGLNQLQYLSAEYPELIYDGPFSDGAREREIKGLSGDEITASEAYDKFNAYFAEYSVKNVQNAGESTEGIECYNLQAEVDGEILFAQISKKEGKLIMFAFAGSCNSTELGQEECIQRAQSFLEKLEIENMKPVWTGKESNVYTVNFAYESEGVIVYSDLIKVRVCAETGMVIGLEGTSYWTNHTIRSVAKPKLTEAQAQSKTSANIDVRTKRLAVVPIGTSDEKLCYEFCGTYDGDTYYVYIDAATGKQVELFKVVRSTEGMLLM